MKTKISFILVLIAITSVTNKLYSQLVSTSTALNNAITAAVPGSTIILADGIWNNTLIKFKKTGTAAAPITIKAQTAGNVFMQGNSRIAMGGAYINIEGLVFKNASGLVTSSSTIEPVISFRYDSSNNCNNCKVKNVKIDSYNGTSSQATDTFKWIALFGQYNEISYTSFIGKNGVGSAINDNRDVTTINYNKIHHNYFADRTFVGSYVDEYNDQDAIRIGNSATSLSDSYTEVYENLFNNWFGEIEVISNKSGHNKYYNNTFRNYSGSLTLRHGNDCEVFGNFFLANNNQFSGGIRVLGENHKIYNNYIEGVNSTKSTAAGGGNSTNLGGINLIAGKTTSVGGADLSGYYQVKNIIITNNTFVNGDFGIRLGGGSNTLAATGMVAANNIFLMQSSSKIAVDEVIPAISGSPYTFTKNIRQSGTWTLNGTLNSNQVVTSNLLTSGADFYRVGASSAAVDTAIGTYSFLTKDILNGNRPALYDVGAEEFAAGGTKLPYNVADVGTLIGFLGTNSVLNTSENITISKGIVLYPNPTKGENITISAEQIIGKIALYDSNGRFLLTKDINSKTGQLEVSSLNKGVYIIKILNSYKRFIVE
jgi:poly(beta-D-mannuronate) lyase